MIFFLYLLTISLVLVLVYYFLINKKNKKIKDDNFQLKSFNTPVSVHELVVPKNKSRITINILFYPENIEDKEIRVSIHSILENKLYTYYQDGQPYQSSEILPKIIENHEELLKYRGTPETEKIIYTSNEDIKHTQSFNVIPNVSKLLVLMKFRGKYKITIT